VAQWRFEKSDEFDSSVDEALRKVAGPPKKVARNLKAKLENLQEQSVEDLNKRSEGTIKCSDNKERKFFAIDYKERVRLYIVQADDNVLFFSHATFKKQKKLSQSDTDRVQKNYRAYESEQGKET
tara:strand:+ start:1978 stop:2352 length:375 start_codon:yes stop_codon:yes gene_type:complete